MVTMVTTAMCSTVCHVPSWLVATAGSNVLTRLFLARLIGQHMRSNWAWPMHSLIGWMDITAACLYCDKG
jgi:hypothetical protein